MRVRARLVARLLGAAIFSAVIMASAGAASAAAKAEPPDREWPAFLKGSVTGYAKDFNGYSTKTDHWEIAGLKLKRERVKVVGRQIQVVYRITDGTVTWRSEEDRTCIGPVSFTETFSLKGIKWDRDSRITFFAPRKGRFKNRWRMDGQIDLVRTKQVGVCPDYPFYPVTAGLPSLVSGTRVGGTPPVATPGKKVRLTYEGHDAYSGWVRDRKDTLTIPIPR